MKIDKIIWDASYDSTGTINYTAAQVGHALMKGLSIVTRIEKVRDNGNLWFEIYLEDNTMMEIYTPSEVCYVPE